MGGLNFATPRNVPLGGNASFVSLIWHFRSRSVNEKQMLIFDHVNKKKKIKKICFTNFYPNWYGLMEYIL